MKRVSESGRLLYALGFSSAVSVFLFVSRAVHYDTHAYWFLNWNLFLAWLPLLFAWQLYRWTQTRPWLSWQGIVLTILWLGFLPNSFYLTSDLIHLQSTAVINVLYDTVMLLSFALNGLILGYISLYLVHSQLVKRIRPRAASITVAGVLLLCSFAIYLGRYLRWSSWDVIINPAGILFDVSDRIINPVSHPQTFVTTATFFLLLGSLYLVIWEMTEFLKGQKDGK
jgi:uncharacterized membrane protein